MQRRRCIVLQISPCCMGSPALSHHSSSFLHTGEHGHVRKDRMICHETIFAQFLIQHLSRTFPMKMKSFPAFYPCIPPLRLCVILKNVRFSPDAFQFSKAPMSLTLPPSPLPPLSLPCDYSTVPCPLCSLRLD